MTDAAAPSVEHVTQYLAGMPNLAFTGLSENWLLKECGHQHWLALAALHDRPLPDFRDAEQRIAYAAFTSVHSQDLQLQAIAENRTFCIATQLSRAGANRHVSEQRLMLGERCMGAVTLVSTFVSRHHAGDNRSIAKACLLGSVAHAMPSSATRLLHNQSKQLRSGRWTHYMGLVRQHCIDLPPYYHRPCPDADFNGAELFYFANFQALADRAEWSVMKLRRPGQVRQRAIHFYGNLNIGDSLLVQLRCDESSHRSRHWCEVSRQSDGVKLADIFTEKHWPSECMR